MIRAVIFDCFGVLTYDGWLPFKKKHFGEGTDKATEASDLARQVNAGLLDYSAFTRRIADMAGISHEATQRAIHDNVPNEELFSYIRDRLKPQYQIGLLSNTGRDMLGTIFSDEEIGLFNAVALSYDTGFIKPDRRAYETIAERLGVPAEECVFIDDQERYCSAARDVGMQAVWYRDFDQMRDDLEALLGK
jgi:putative hydrolase of the HAD superfamily